MFYTYQLMSADQCIVVINTGGPMSCVYVIPIVGQQFVVQQISIHFPIAFRRQCIKYVPNINRLAEWVVVTDIYKWADTLSIQMCHKHCLVNRSVLQIYLPMIDLGSWSISWSINQIYKQWFCPPSNLCKIYLLELPQSSMRWLVNGSVIYDV